MSLFKCTAFRPVWVAAGVALCLTVGAQPGVGQEVERLLRIERRQPPLPADAQQVLDRYTLEQEAAQRDYQAKAEERRQDLIRQLQILHDTYEKADHPAEANAIASRIAQLKGNDQAGPSPSLMLYRNRVGQTFDFTVTGTVDGPVWGSGIYTDDSSVAAAAVHAGVLRNGERGTVRVTILPGREKYDASEANGVAARPYGPWEGSFKFLGAAANKEARPAAPAAIHLNNAKDRAVNPQSLASLRDAVGDSFDLEITGSTRGSIWGNLVYTDDSDIATAAVHAGLLKEGETGTVRVTLLPAQESYDEATAHGVTSRSYKAWQGSFTVDLLEKRPPAAEPKPDGIAPEK